MTAGLLFDGKLVDVPGVTIVPPASRGGPAWNRLSAEDYRARTAPISLIVLHTTGGHWPQPLLTAPGKPGHARQIFDLWDGADRRGGEREHSGAPIVVDFDGTAYCAADVVRTAAWHAQAVSHRSIGIEMCTERDGAIHEATLVTTVRIICALTHSGFAGSGLLAIPAQMPRGPYRNQPLRRLELNGEQTDGRGLIGVTGHRDQTCRRGYGDPGNEIWKRLADVGFEGVDYDGEEDLHLGRARQARLNAIDAKAGNTFRPLVVDGVFGPATAATMQRLGFKRWRDVA